MIAWACVLGGAQVVLSLTDRTEARVRQDRIPVIDLDTTPTATLSRRERSSSISLTHFVRASLRGITGEPSGRDLYQGLSLNAGYAPTRRLSVGISGGGVYGISDFTSLAATPVTSPTSSDTAAAPPAPTSPLLNRVPRGPLQTIGGNIGIGLGYRVNRADFLNGYATLSSSTGLGASDAAFPAQTLGTAGLNYRISVDRTVSVGPMLTTVIARTEGGILSQVYTAAITTNVRLSRRDQFSSSAGLSISRTNAAGIATDSLDPFPTPIIGRTRTVPAPALTMTYTRQLPGRATLTVNGGYGAVVDRLTGALDQRLTMDVNYRERFGTRWSSLAGAGFARSLGGRTGTTIALTSFFGSVGVGYQALRWLAVDGGLRWFGSDAIDPLLAGFVGVTVLAPTTRW